MDLLKIGENGQREINYEAVEAMTSAGLAQKLKDTIRKRKSIFKIETQKVSGLSNDYLVFRLIAGIRNPSSYIEFTYNQSEGNVFGERDIALFDLEEIAAFIADEKQIAAGEGDYLNTVAHEKAPTNILPFTEQIDKNENTAD
jgi:hypothetical protein